MSMLILTEVTNYTLPDFIEKGENVVVLGMFDSLQLVNHFVRTYPRYPEGIRFVQENENIYFDDLQKTPILLQLQRVAENPHNKVGEVVAAFRDEPTIENLLTDDKHQVGFVNYKKRGYSCQPFQFSKSSMSLQFWGWAIVLNEDGTWFMEDTSGG